MHGLKYFGVVLVLVGCAGGPTPAGSEGTGAASETAASEATTSSSGGSTMEETSTNEAPTSSTSGSSTAESSTTEAPVVYCQGFDRDAPAPFLELTVKGGAALVDGVEWPLECGGQGLWMFALYPSLGGFEPGGYYPHVTVIVDVEGYDLGPTGHFYHRQGESYYIGCEQSDGGVFGVVPVFPPDELAKLSEVDGLPAQVHVEVETAEGPLTVDALVTLSAPPELVKQGCIL
ncbi:hypothetical protein [Nannocystis punicea]|uniref:Lipoprotein n=1 Tax=Nannocystis punicea TaxID=2995304 RepID=A0ABY7HF42_9BACT|nr:hypothetical protein [Nannocystis poenicansa]WAS97904.1 hypothetical protein O0S08_17320 [Nannocystis poenicansa]